MIKTYVYANSQILAQHDGDTGAPRYFYLHDRLGSVREIVNTSGQAVCHYTFDSFGQTIEESGTLTNPFMFTGQYYDSQIGWYYLRARQYDPQLMRFTGRDPVEGKFEETMSLHKYLYCQNNPINYADPSGLMSGAQLVNEELRRADLEHNGRIYEAMANSGDITDLDALCDMVNLTACWANMVNDRIQFIEDLLWLFTERGPFMTRANGNLHLIFKEEGFRSEYAL